MLGFWQLTLRLTHAEPKASAGLVDQVADLRVDLARAKELAKTADAMIAEFEAHARLTLPYGVLTCADGREVLFNRDYTLLYSRCPGQLATLADRDEFVPFIRQEHFYHAGEEPWRNPDELWRDLLLILKSWGVYGKQD